MAYRECVRNDDMMEIVGESDDDKLILDEDDAFELDFSENLSSSS